MRLVLALFVAAVVLSVWLFAPMREGEPEVISMPQVLRIAPPEKGEGPADIGDAISARSSPKRSPPIKPRPFRIPGNWPQNWGCPRKSYDVGSRHRILNRSMWSRSLIDLCCRL